MKNPHPVTEIERHREVPETLRSDEVNQIEELRQEGLSICAIAAATGFDR